MGKIKEVKRLSALFDIKVETLAATLLENKEEATEFTLENILVAPIGSQHRRARQDIEDIKKKYFEYEEALMFKINRKGFYDTLPERLFLKLDSEFDTPKKRTKELRRQEAEARKFFLPYEQATFHPRIEIELFEQKYSNTFPDFIQRLWGLEKFKGKLTNAETFLLCHLIPEAYRVVGNCELTTLIFQTILKKPVELNFKAPEYLTIAKKKVEGSEMRLGEDSIMGDSFRDEFPLLEICIKGITTTDLFDFLPQGDRRLIIEDLLCAYFIALDVPYKITLDVTEDSLGFYLGDSVMGYNMMLN